MMNEKYVGAVGILLTMVSPLTADERLKGIACRSVHLSYGESDKIAFYNEVTIRQSAPGTFFMVCGWNTGYFGLQELGDGKKLLIFSVWDNTRGDDPRTVAEDVRVKLLHQDRAVRVGRFGGEGTGGQSFLDYPWEIGETYRLMVSCQPSGERTEYSGYFFHPQQKEWIKLVTFSTVTSGQRMRGFYSFVEDFQRDRLSTRHVRLAEFGNGWLASADGQWQAVSKARFTGDANPVENIDAGTVGQSGFFLATGGDTQNGTNKLGSQIQVQRTAEVCPEDVRAILAE